MSQRNHNGQESAYTRKSNFFRKRMIRAAQWLITALYPWPRGKRLKNGLTLMIDPKKRWIDFNLAVRSHYEEGTLLLIEKLLPEGGVFVDVGANIGVMSTFAARHVGDEGLILAVEPDSINFERLTWAREKNSLPQMIPLPIALGGQKTMASLRQSPDGDGGLSSLVDIEGFKEYSAVPVVRMDDIVSAFPVSRIDLIKIDVEGFEKDVIDGAAEVLNHFKPAVIMEMVNDDAVFAGEVLLGLGYVSFIAGKKGGSVIKVLSRTKPKRLDHNNMLFIHSSKCETLSKAGFTLV